MKPTPYDKYWNNPQNWKWHVFYICKDDPRIIVPKKPQWIGRTLNFAHSKSFLVLLLTILVMVGPLPFYGSMGGRLWWLVYVAVITGVVLFYYKAQIYQKLSNAPDTGSSAKEDG